MVAALLLAAALSGACVHAAHAQDPDSLRAAERARQEKEREEKRDIFVNRILFVGNKGASAGELKARMRTREPGFFSIFRKRGLDEILLPSGLGASNPVAPCAGREDR